MLYLTLKQPLSITDLQSILKIVSFWLPSAQVQLQRQMGLDLADEGVLAISTFGVENMILGNLCNELTRQTSLSHITLNLRSRGSNDAGWKLVR
jgi:hypothetical protein